MVGFQWVFKTTSSRCILHCKGDSKDIPDIVINHRVDLHIEKECTGCWNTWHPSILHVLIYVLYMNPKPLCVLSIYKRSLLEVCIALNGLRLGVALIHPRATFGPEWQM